MTQWVIVELQISIVIFQYNNYMGGLGLVDMQRLQYNTVAMVITLLFNWCW